eukprot:CAMPEP_0178903822 /NCGR_PEP_ID=MMETSP0786-20121207/5361_1 /TAXON_ID=186022 /ORGANISM="Thalassionema frauenfeldii, Strain CCMP 1798" /LENGTH=488 /DNA_ID=CAMNT_0020575217 /DNA_START=105 /DNA_END=1571 /DNA_ORIENTATION=+
MKVVASRSSLSKNKNPIVVSFPGGFPQSVIQNDDIDHNNNNSGTPPEFVWRRLHAPPNDAKPDTSKKNKDDEKYEKGRRVVGRDRTCTYESVLPTKAPTKTHRLCVGVLDKRSGILRVSLAADDGHVFALEQSVIGYKDNGSDATATPSKLKSAAERHRALFSSFGSSKKRKVLKSQEANRVTVDTTVGGLSSEAFTNQSKMSESNRKALQDQKSLQQDGQNREPLDAVALAYAEARQKLLPKWNETAEKPSLVYDARDMAGKSAWERLYAQTSNPDRMIGDASSQGRPGAISWHNVLKSPIMETIEAKNNSSNKNDIRQMLTTALLLNHMISLWNGVAFTSRPVRGETKDLSRDFNIANVDLTARFIGLFLTSTGNGGRYALSAQDRDRLLIHILLLYLIVNGISHNSKEEEIMKVTTMEPLFTQLKGEKTSGRNALQSVNMITLATNLLREAGCTIQKRRKNDIAVELKIPLTFPMAPQKKLKRGR